MKFQTKLKVILQKYVLNNILYKILSVIFAFVLWLVILNITDPESSKTFNNIQVKIENEQLVLDGSHVYTITSGETTSLTITGKRSVITNLSAKDFVVSANFAELSITNAVPISVSLSGAKARYTNQISMVLKDTSMIINYEEMTSKQIPVEIEYIGEPHDGLVVDEANLQPKKITISAPASITDSAEKAVVSVNYDEIYDGAELVLPFIIYGNDGSAIKESSETSTDIDEITADFIVSYEKQVRLLVEPSGTPAYGYKLDRYELSQDTITLKGTEEDISGLESITISGSAVDINGADADFDTEVDVTPFLPEGITVYGESPNVIVSFKIAAAEEK